MFQKHKCSLKFEMQILFRSARTSIIFDWPVKTSLIFSSSSSVTPVTRAFRHSRHPRHLSHDPESISWTFREQVLVSCKELPIIQWPIFLFRSDLKFRADLGLISRLSPMCIGIDKDPIWSLMEWLGSMWPPRSLMECIFSGGWQELQNWSNSGI